MGICRKEVGKVGRQADAQPWSDLFWGPTTYAHGTAKKNEIPLFLFRVKLESLESLGKEASLALR